MNSKTILPPLGTQPAAEQCSEDKLIDEELHRVIKEFLKEAGKIPDWRSTNIVYPLPPVLTMIMLARLDEQDTPKAIAHFVKLKQNELVAYFKLKRNSVPCEGTLRTVLDKVGGYDFSQLWLDAEAMLGAQQPDLLVAVDGKNCVESYTMAVYGVDSGAVLAQCEVSDKTNEIAVVRQLLDQIELEGRMVSADALHAQQSLSQYIIERGADFLLLIKENQPNLLAKIKSVFEGNANPDQIQRVCEMVNKGHGRVEKRHLAVLNVDESQIEWPGVRQIFCLTRDVHHLTTGEKTSSVVYGITSHATATPEDLSQSARNYWHIENKLHYRRNVTLNENKLRTKFPNIRKAMATFNNFIVGLVARYEFQNLPTMRRVFKDSLPRVLKQIPPEDEVVSGE